MDFLDNVVKSSNAILKDRIKAPLQSFDQSKLTKPFNNLLASAKDATANITQQQQATSQPQEQPAVDDSSSQAQQQAEATTAAAPQATSSTVGDATSAAATAAAGDESAQGISSAQVKAQLDSIAADAQAVGQKTVEGAKNIGNFLFSMSMKASQSVSASVSQTASKVKQAVNSSLSADGALTKEQLEFARQHRLSASGSIQAGALPWHCDSFADEPDRQGALREQVLLLSQDRRNFVRAPPAEARFVFDGKLCYPVAMSLLREDPALVTLRQELVPKLITEEAFWCNYFYRIEMLKQELASSSSTGDAAVANKSGASKSFASSRSSSGEGPDVENPNSSISYNAEHSTPSNAAAAAAANDGRQQQYSQATLDYSSFYEPRGPATPKSTPNSTFEAQDSFGGQHYTEQTAAGTAAKRDSLESDSNKVLAEAESLKDRLKALNIGSFDELQ